MHDTVRTTLRGVVVGVLLLLLLGALASRAGWIVAEPPRPAGQGAWLLSRATGLVAYVAASLEVVVGLLVSTRLGDRIASRGVLVDLHSWLSPLVLVLVVAHAGVLLADRYVRYDVLDVALPFASIPIGLGVLAAYALGVVHASFALRKRIGPAAWRKLHALSFVAFTGATVHALAAGTDVRRPWFVLVIVALLAPVAALIVVRLRRRCA